MESKTRSIFLYIESSIFPYTVSKVRYFDVIETFDSIVSLIFRYIETFDTLLLFVHCGTFPPPVRYHRLRCLSPPFLSHFSSRNIKKKLISSVSCWLVLFLPIYLPVLKHFLTLFSLLVFCCLLLMMPTCFRCFTCVRRTRF